MELEPRVIKPEMLAGMFMEMQMDLSLPTQQMILECIDERIGEIRADIISNEKTAGEIDALLDEMLILAVEKNGIESKIAAIRYARHVRKKMEVSIEREDRGKTLREIFKGES